MRYQWLSLATGNGEAGKRVPNERLVAPIQTFSLGKPSDRLSQALFSAYGELVRQDLVTLEIEMISCMPGSNQQRDELDRVTTIMEP